jgi:hypothetical protein
MAITQTSEFDDELFLAMSLPLLDLLHKIAQALSIRMSELYAITESNSNSGEKLMQEDQADYANEVILMRRHFQSLTPANRDLAIELIKVLMRTQSAEP